MLENRFNMFHKNITILHKIRLHTNHDLRKLSLGRIHTIETIDETIIDAKSKTIVIGRKQLTT